MSFVSAGFDCEPWPKPTGFLAIKAPPTGYVGDPRPAPLIRPGLPKRAPKTDRERLNDRKDRILSEMGRACHFCGCGLNRRNVTREHLLPTSRGGANSGANVVAACKRCNSAKGDMTEQEFRGWLQRVARNLGLCD